MFNINPNPILSIIASAVRVNVWMDFYNSIATDINYPFEIVFVGDKKPDFELPYNFKYIYSAVKPTQCVEIAARNSTGDYLCDSADDLCFSSHFFDILINNMNNIKEENVALVPMISRNGIMKKGSLRIKKHDNDSPEVGMITFIRRKMWHKLGGIDKNFISGWHNHDIKLRLIENGGTCIMIKEAIANENDTNSPVLLRNVSGKEDKEFLYSCWYNKDIFSKKRLKKFEPFYEEDLLNKSQGKTGKWR